MNLNNKYKEENNMRKNKKIITILLVMFMILGIGVTKAVADEYLYRYKLVELDTTANIANEPIIGGKNYNLLMSIADENYVGYYADVDNNDTIDGLIFFDYVQGADTTPGFLGAGVNVTSKNREDLATYALKTVNGVDNVVVKTGDGDDRFYVIGLQNVKPASEDSTAYWYYSAYANKISDYAGLTSTAFGSGKSNTETMKALWDEEAYGAKNNRDIFTIETGDWFIPSKDEWSVLGSNLKKVAGSKDAYKSMNFPSGAKIGFSYNYWSSSIYGATYAWGTYFGLSSMYGINFNDTSYVRLASTF